MRRCGKLCLGLALLAGPLRAQWTRASVGNFRLYTDAPESFLAPLLDDLITTERDFQTVWPSAPLAGQPPGVLIFCADPVIYHQLNPEVDGFSLAIAAGASADWTYAMTVNLTSPVRGEPVPAGPALRRFYAGYLVRSVGERIPPWLNLGLLKFMVSAHFADGAIELPALAADLNLPGRSGGDEAGLQQAVLGRSYFSLEELLGAAKAPQGQDGVAFAYENGRGAALQVSVAAGTFVDESVEFIEYCLFGERGRYRPAFFRFVRAAANGPLDEADFRRFFGMDYHALQLAIWRSREFSRSRLVRLPAPARGVIGGLPPGSFQPAPEQEVSYLETKWLAAHAPGDDHAYDSETKELATRAPADGGN